MGLDFDQVLQYLDNEFAVQLIATVVKFLVMFLICVHVPPIMVWAERRIPALMQRRRGPNRVGFNLDFGKFKFQWRFFGLLQTAADAIKLILKEEVVPAGANKTFFQLAPVFGVFSAFLVAAAIPYGNDFTLFGYTIPLSVISLDVGFLFIFAIASMGVYGVALAGWAANNKYSLMGALRASASMISYEIPLGLSLIPIVLIYGTLDLNSIVVAQGNIWNWGIVTSPVSFMLFFICMFAETNRAPFDMAESESELVAGFFTEYGSAKFAAIFLGEYVAMFALSCLAATIFFGGWQIPFVSYDTLVGLVGGSTMIASLIGVMVLLVKAGFFMFMYIWVRWTLPRFRYDQLMSLGWKFMLPIGIANVFVTAIVIAALNFK